MGQFETISVRIYGHPHRKWKLYIFWCI